MKKFLLFCSLLFVAATASSQTNTWTGNASNLWNNAGNWDLNMVPNGAHDVVIPSGSTVTLNVATTINSINVQGSATFAINAAMAIADESTFESGVTADWSTGTISGSGTLTNQGTLSLTTANNKSIAAGFVMNNEGTIINAGTGDLYISDGIVNNQVSGMINLTVDSGNLSYSGSGSHVLNNFGTIKKTAGIGGATIECELHNSGTISVESGTLTLLNSDIELTGGNYNVSSGSMLIWDNTVTMTGNMTGVIDGLISWGGVVSIPVSQSAQWNFTGAGGIDWNSGSLTGGGTLDNNSKITLSTANNKTLNGDITFNNSNLMIIADTGDLYVSDAVFNNLATGIIDMQVDQGNLSLSGSGSHVLNNYGLIKKTSTSGLSSIQSELKNFGTIQVETGNLTLSNDAITLTAGTYNISSGGFLSINQTVTATGLLSGTVTGEIIWNGNLIIPAAQSASFGFTGNGNINWQNGSLSGGGALTNNFTMRLSTANNKSILGATTFNNQALIYFQTTGDLYISNGIVNNQASGIIDLRSDSANLSYSGSGSHVLNNFGLIRRTTSSGIVAIECEFHNSGTVTVSSGTLLLQTNPIFLNGGIYNVAAGTVLQWNDTVTCAGNLTGLVDGMIVWLGNTAVPGTSSLSFTGAGHISWQSGAITGGGELENHFKINFHTANNKSITAATEVANFGLMTFTDTGDLYISDGTLTNTISGIIDMANDSGNLSYSGSGLHLLVNNGLIKKTTSGGFAAINCDLQNNGTLSVESGTMALADNPSFLNGGVYNVSAGTAMEWQNTVNVSGVLSGVVNGPIRWLSTVAVGATAEFSFSGNGAIDWQSGQLAGSGQLQNNFNIHLSTANNKQIAGMTTLDNATLMTIIGTGDLYISDGVLNNLAGGTIDMQTDAGNLSYSGSGAHILNNYGLIKKSAGSGTAIIESNTTNYGTIEVQSGTIALASFPFVNEVSGIIAGTGTIILPSAALYSNLGSFSPGSSPGVLNVTGGFESAPTSSLIVDLNGLTSGTQHDLLAVAGNAIFDGSVVINLGYPAAIDDSFTIATTSGTISNCNLASSALDVYEDLEYTFSVTCVENDSVVLKVTNIEAIPPTVAEQTFCAGATVADLVADGSNLQWYVALTGGLPLSDATVLVSGNYYVSQTVSGFESERATAPVIINTTPAPSASNQNFSNGATVADLVATGTNLKWYSQPAGGTQLLLTTVLSSGTYYVSQTLNSCESIRTAFEVTINNANGMFYVDGDGDSYGTGELVSVPSEDPEVAPEGYSLNNTDCDDNNATVYQSDTLYVDADNDGYDNGTEIVCYGTTIPAGFIVETLGTDCDDTDATAFTGFPFYVDQDGDTFGTGELVTVCTPSATVAPAGYSLNNTDCDDNDVMIFQLESLYIDADGDGYDNGTEDVCYGVAIPDGFTEETLGADCDDADANTFIGYPFYVDQDGDTFGIGELVIVCTTNGTTPPSGYSLNNSDCDDNDSSVYQSANLFIDNDGDGYDNGSATVCYGSIIPVGYSETTSGADCDDTNAGNTAGYMFYTDADGDTYGTGQQTLVCTNDPDTAPAGYSLNDSDCDDNDATVYQLATLFIDNDGDGYDNGMDDVCYGEMVPEGYATSTSGPDCDDANATNSTGYMFYVDSDGDTFGSGEGQLICTDDPDTAPAGYSVTDNDCDDANAGINPGTNEVFYNGIDDNCDGALDEGNQILSQLVAEQCGSTIATLGTTIYAANQNNATAYRFEVTNLSTNAVQVLERPVRWFKLTMLTSHDYATTYSVRVEIQRNGIWLGYFGPACLISSPAILGPDGAAQITAAQCGATLASLSTIIMTNSVQNATGYRFRVTNLTDPTAPNQVQTLDRPLRWFSLTMLPTFNYGTTYMIEVAVKTTGDYSGFGNPCQISTPAVPTLSNCGQVVATAGSIVSTFSYNNAMMYRFELTDLSTGIITTLDRPLHWFRFNMIANYTEGADYSIRIAVMTTGHYSPFGPSCTITAPGNLAAHAAPAKISKVDFKAVAYPNPYSDVFLIDVKSDSEQPVQVNVYDMMGKLLESREVSITDMEAVGIGQRYPSGVYTVIISQEKNLKTLRVVKR